MIKLYPRDQIKNYLLIDVICIVFLFYIVLSSDSSLSLLNKFFLLLAFLASFYIGLWYRGWYHFIAILAGLTATAVLAMNMSYHLVYFGFIFADLLGRSKSKWQISAGIAAIGLMFIFVIWKKIDSVHTLGNTIILPIMIIQMALPIVIYIKDKAKSLQGELDAAHKQLEKYIQQEERQRIARDLHDTLGQTLTMIKMKSELATRWVDHDPKQAKEELKDILATSRVALKQVRELVSDMKFISLSSEIEHSRKLLHTAGIELEFMEKGQPPLLSSVEETMLSLSVREAVTNIIKHSQAQRCMIKLHLEDNHYCVEIADDGVGLVKRDNGNGIPSMSERMQALDGTFLINSSPEGGTVVSMKLPLRQQGKESVET